MATLYISYYGDSANNVAAAPIKTDTITTSVTSALSAAIPSGARFASFFSSGAAHAVTFGDSATTAALTNSVYIPQSVKVDIKLPQPRDNSTYVAAITS